METDFFVALVAVDDAASSCTSAPCADGHTSKSAAATSEASKDRIASSSLEISFGVDVDKIAAPRVAKRMSVKALKDG